MQWPKAGPVPKMSAEKLPSKKARQFALADRARFVLPCHVVVEILALGWGGHQRLVHWRRYVKIAGDRPALKLHLKHMSDGMYPTDFRPVEVMSFRVMAQRSTLVNEQFQAETQLSIVMSMLRVVGTLVGCTCKRN